jgi:hypothetical protein
VRLRNGTVLELAGINDSGALRSAEIYQPKSNRWSTVASLHGARLHQTATLLNTGAVLVAAGALADGTVLATAELYAAHKG